MEMRSNHENKNNGTLIYTAEIFLKISSFSYASNAVEPTVYGN